MLVEPNSVCQITIGSTVHTLRVFLRIKSALTQPQVEKEFTEWLRGRDLQDIYDGLKKKIRSGVLSTHDNEVPYNWYRDAVFVYWLLETNQGVDAMSELAQAATILIATCNKTDDGQLAGQVRRFGEHSQIMSYADPDPESPDLARWRKFQAEAAERRNKQ